MERDCDRFERAKADHEEARAKLAALAVEEMEKRLYPLGRLKVVPRQTPLDSKARRIADLDIPWRVEPYTDCLSLVVDSSEGVVGRFPNARAEFIAEAANAKAVTL